MSLTSCLRRAPLVLGGAIVMMASTGATVAWAHGGGSGPIGPHQSFVGLINGSDGVEGPVGINMACFGPVRPGQRGHPMAGQSVGVAGREVAAETFGRTGSEGTSIVAFFGFPATATGSVTFHRRVTVKIPTSLYLPCSGSGTVTFVALPKRSRARSFSVPVAFAGQP